MVHRQRRPLVLGQRLTPWIPCSVYGLHALVAGLNLAWMRRPSEPGECSLVFLIPARNEADNLARLIPALRLSDPEIRIVVFDDESTDGTGDVATQNGASVLTPKEKLPPGWKGKNRACHELGHNAPDADWIVFIDADVYPSPNFIPKLKGMLNRTYAPVVSAMPQVLPGKFPEPVFMLWVGWTILCTNPFGLVSKTQKGHNRFTNGQFHAWRPKTYLELRPNETLKDKILEDVGIGRLCAERKIPVEVFNLSEVFGVKMYETWREALDGMSKNSYEIMGTTGGTIFWAGLLLFWGWFWLAAGALWWLPFGLLMLSTALMARITKSNPLSAIVTPIGLTIGAYTAIRSLVWKKRGTVMWKGRTYS